jgi:hypothetical protein
LWCAAATIILDTAKTISLSALLLVVTKRTGERVVVFVVDMVLATVSQRKKCHGKEQRELQLAHTWCTTLLPGPRRYDLK